MRLYESKSNDVPFNVLAAARRAAIEECGNQNITDGRGRRQGESITTTTATTVAATATAVSAATTTTVAAATATTTTTAAAATAAAIFTRTCFVNRQRPSLEFCSVQRFNGFASAIFHLNKAEAP